MTTAGRDQPFATIEVRAEIRPDLQVYPSNVQAVLPYKYREKPYEFSIEVRNYSDVDWQDIQVSSSTDWLTITQIEPTGNLKDGPRQSWVVTATADFRDVDETRSSTEPYLAKIVVVDLPERKCESVSQLCLSLRSAVTVVPQRLAFSLEGKEVSKKLIISGESLDIRSVKVSVVPEGFGGMLRIETSAIGKGRGIVTISRTAASFDEIPNSLAIQIQSGCQDGPDVLVPITFY